MGQERFDRVEIDPLSALQADDIEDAPLDGGEDVEYPDRSRDIEVDEIEKACPGRTKPEIQADCIAEQGQCEGFGDLGKARKVGV